MNNNLKSNLLKQSPKMEATSNSRQALWVGIGQFFSFTIGIVSPMILSRYFGEGDYGTYKQVMYVYNTLLTVFAFGLPRAYSYFIPRVSLSESKSIIKKITVLFSVIGLCFSTLLFGGAHFLSTLLNNADLELAIKLFSPTPMFLLPVMGLDCILASYKRARILAIYTVTTKLFTLLCIILPVVMFNGTYIHAIIGFDVASLLTFILAFYLRNIPTRRVHSQKTAIKYLDIIAYSAPLMVASIWIMLYQSANQFFISRYYGNEVFAEFSNGFIDFPIIPMIISSVATVLLPIFSSLADKRQAIEDLWMRTISKIVKLTYPICTFCIVFSPLVMTCFYGENYECSSSYFTLKSIENLFLIIPFYPILMALGRTKVYSNIQLISAIMIILLEYLVISMGLSPIYIGVAFVICSLTKTYLQFRAVSRAIDVKMTEFLPHGIMLKVFCISALSSLLPLIFSIRLSQYNSFTILFTALFIYVLCYYVLCWFFHISYKDIIYPCIENLRWPRIKSILRIIP